MAAAVSPGRVTQDDIVELDVDGRLVGFDTKALLQTENTYYRHASKLAAGTTER